MVTLHQKYILSSHTGLVFNPDYPSTKLYDLEDISLPPRFCYSGQKCIQLSVFPRVAYNVSICKKKKEICKLLRASTKDGFNLGHPPSYHDNRRDKTQLMKVVPAGVIDGGWWEEFSYRMARRTAFSP